MDDTATENRGQPRDLSVLANDPLPYSDEYLALGAPGYPSCTNVIGAEVVLPRAIPAAPGATGPRSGPASPQAR